METKVRILAQPQGFDKVQQEATKLANVQKRTFIEQQKGFREAEKSVDGYKRQVKDLEGQLQKLARRQLDLNTLMKGFDRESKPFKALAAEMKNIDQEAGRTERTIRLLERSFRDHAKAARESEQATRAARGAFTQGLAQGAGVGEFIQRGPGMMKQAAGRMLGSTLIGTPMRVGAGFASMPFTGLGGAIQGLNALPLGGLISGPLSQAMGFAQTALDFDRQRLEANPFLSGAMQDRGAIRAAISRAGLSDDDINRRANMAALGAPETAAQKVISKRSEKPLPIAMFSARNEMMSARNVEPTITDVATHQLPVLTASEIREKERKRLRAQRASMSADDMSKIGLDFGMTAQEATTFASQLSHVGGGRGREIMANGGGFLRAAMGAQRAFGVGAEVSGAFLGAGRAGAVQGVTGATSGDFLAKSIGEAMRMGLEGSEIVDYLATMAQGFDQWKATGIPINVNAGGIGAMLSGNGIGGIQGARIAGGINARAQTLSTGGPQNATDMLMLQAAGFRGGGAADLLKARKGMENMSPEQVASFLSKAATATGSGAGGEMAFQNVLSSMGITTSASLNEKIFSAASSGKLTAESFKALTGEEVGKMGVGVTDKFGAVRASASIQNQQLGVGASLVGPMLDLERSTTNVASSFKVLAPQISKLTQSVSEFSEVVPKAVQAMKDGSFMSFIMGGQ